MIQRLVGGVTWAGLMVCRVDLEEMYRISFLHIIMVLSFNSSHDFIVYRYLEGLGDLTSTRAVKAS